MSHLPQDNPHALEPLSPADERLERYLDGLMSPAERAEFEATSAANPAVAAQIDAHRQLTATLGKHYDTSTQLTSDGAVAAPIPFPARGHSPRKLAKVASIAAAVLVPLCVAAYVFMAPKAGQPVVIKPTTSEEYQKRHRDYMVAEYAKQVKSGFKPREVCTTDEQFAKWTKDTFGYALVPSHPAPGSGAPAEPVLAGWSKGTVFSSYSGLLLAHVDGQPVMVVMDNAPPDRMVPQEDPTSNPRIFRRKVNEVWMIEITPLDKPRVITNIEAGEGPKAE